MGYARIDPTTGQRYYGRGLIQITGEANYKAYGEKVGVDLLHHPDLALRPDIAAKILALYFKNHAGGAIIHACEARGWEEVRRLVNGGLNGFGQFHQCVQALLKLVC
jgi:predicted chitinase